MTIYIEVKNSRGTIYIRNDILTELAKVDTIVFDCDGVLLDVRNAYNVAIAATTKIIIEAFTGAVIPKEMFDSELNHYFKRTGGFNNDWILFLFTVWSQNGMIRADFGANAAKGAFAAFEF